MVALNPAYAPCKSIDTAQNRAGDFFYESRDRVGSNRLSAHYPRRENELTFTISASGLPYFINADPIGFAGGLNWYQYAAGNPIMYGDPSGNSPALLLIPLIWWGTTQTANAPGPGDRTTNDTPFVAPASMALGVGPTVAASRTIVRSSMTAGRGFMNTLTGPATSSAVRNAGTMSFEAGNAGLSLMTQAGTQAATNALRQFASQALSYGGVYTAGTFVGGGITGLLTPTDASSLFPSGNPLMAPFEAGNLAGSFVGNTYNAVSEFFAQPVSTNFK